MVKKVVTEGTKVRCLQDGAYGNVNEVVTVPEAELAELQANGMVDASPAAVAYAESLVKPAE